MSQSMLPVVGAIVAALIAAGVAYLTAVLSKENKTSEFRQAWIDAIRNDIAEYIGAIETVASFQSRILTAHGGEAVLAYVRSLDPDLRRLAGTYYRICLRLNPVEHAELLQALREVYVFSAPNLDVIKYSEERVERVMNASIDVFRKEWKRVKRGEPTFWITKYVALVVAVAAAVAFFGFLSAHVSLQWK